MSVAIVAFGAVSALGEGPSAVSCGELGEPARVVLARDPELERAGLVRPFAARVSLLGSDAEGDRATALLSKAVTSCARDLDRVLPGWRDKRVGLAVGTSSGALRSAEGVFSRLRKGEGGTGPRFVEGAFYFAPVLRAAETLGLRLAPATLVLGACAASGLAIGLGKRWLEAGQCDVVLAGGFDAVATLVAAGFEVLRATTGSLPPRPFREHRDGMALGEGAAVVALVRSAEHVDARAHVIGFGASSDAVHLTAPDRTGSGLARAAALGLDEAGHPRIDLVSAHGTATPFSDAAEARAVKAVLGEEAAAAVVVHPFKAQIGHTLGAAGVLEVLAAVDALDRGILPAAAGWGAIDPDAAVHLLDRAVPGAPETALKLSAAFGGANAALVLSKRPAPSRARPRFPVYASPAVYVAEEPHASALAAELDQPIEKIGRTDGLTRMALSVVRELTRAHGPLVGAGIVVGETFATLETDATFHARIEDRGVRMAEPRRFPYTSPNAAAGDSSVVFGLTGPGFAVGCGPCAAIEALSVAADLVRSGDAKRMVVVAVDAVGPVVRAMCELLGLDAANGAAGLVLSCEPVFPFVLAETRLELGPWPSGQASLATGHRALLPLVGARAGAGARAREGEGEGEEEGSIVLEAGGPLVRGEREREWAVRATARLDRASV
jgi:3-oxoacyl-[acyl-carrier-protein] synthase II